MAVTDPCAQYEDSAGKVDLLALIDGTLLNIECIVKEASALAGGAGTLVAHGAQLAASQLRAARQAHLAKNPPDTNT